jgi:AbiV family abortive infection protein
LSENLYLKARDACIENVEQYIKDAKKLAEIESYGHAYALLIIGQEELGKAFAYHTMGVSKISPDDLEHYVKMYTKKTQAHIIKLQQYRFLSKLRELQETLKGERSATKAALNVFSEYLAGINALEKGDNNTLKNELSKLVAKEKEINRLKMEAFYVEIIDQGINTPLDPRFKEKVLGVLSETEKTTNFVVNTIFRPHRQTEIYIKYAE